MRSHSYAPNLDIEMYHYCLTNKLFVYVNLVPRRSLVSPQDLQLPGDRNCVPDLISCSWAAVAFDMLARTVCQDLTDTMPCHAASAS
jgi:hypothetical protein